MPCLPRLAVLATASLIAFPAHAQINVVATIGMIGDVAATVGGECATVTTLMAPGIDPHLYKATARDVATFGDAETILFAGYSLEGQLGDVLDRLGERIPTLAVGPAAIPVADLITTADVYGVDPHLWMDAALWARTVPAIAAHLSGLVPACADDIAGRAEDYEAELLALDAWTRDTIATIPVRQRVLVTAHDAFAYYGRAYGIEVAGIQGISTEAEASIADIRETTDLLVEREIPAVFIESTISPRTIQAVIDAAARRGHAVKIGGELFADAMGEAGTAQGTYIGMIFSNTLAIAAALGGTPAPLPEALAPWAERWDIAR